MTSRDPMSRFVAAEKVWDAVEAAGEEGLRGPEICENANLKRGQFENGKAQVRDFMAKEKQKSFIYDGDRYATTRDTGRCALAVVIRVSSVDKQLRRIYDSICEPLGDAADQDPTLSYLKNQIKAMLGNMDVMRSAGFLPKSKKLRANSASKG
ncbi:hypothetical protein [Amycolatopsis sp. NPDC059657]|uniref:hypothetical protein n=1 Tax=Amycolatopsis sp. NPDC059657 TaxID=3346899 RepID=UPI00366B5E28